jgi:hypothetical protein
LTFEAGGSVAMTEIDRRTSFKGIAALAASAVAAEAACSEKPRAAAPGGAPQKPITTGPSQTQGMARFATRTRYEDLTAQRRQRLKIALLDSLACGIAALEASPIQAWLAQTKAFGGSDARCTLIGGGHLATLRRRELDAVGARLSTETGLPYTPAAGGETVAGTYCQRLPLTSGRFAMIDNGLGFALVPWTPELDRHLGRHVAGIAKESGGVEWSFGRKRGLEI